VVTPQLLNLLSEEGYNCRIVMEAWDATLQVVCASAFAGGEHMT
jgi:hypothetical protein